MWTRCWLGAGLVLAAMILPQRPATTHAATGAVYRAGWEQGLSGWKPTSKGFSGAKGVLGYDGRGNALAVAPFRTAGLPNFTIHADIRPYRPVVNAGSEQFVPPFLGFGILVREPDSASRIGIRAGQFQDLRTSDSPIVGPQLAWGNRTIGGSGVAPTGQWQHYRLEVRTYRDGYVYSLSIDRKVAIQSTYITADRGYNGIGIWSIRVPIDVRRFSVRSAPGSAVRNVQDTPALLRLVPVQVPGAMVDLGGHFISNDEYARGQALPLPTVVALGRRLSYVTVLSSNVGTIAYSVARYASSDGAMWEYRRALAAAREFQSAKPSYRLLALSTLGDARQGYTYTTGVEGHLITVGAIDVVKSGYYIRIEIESQSPDAALALIATEVANVLTRV